MNEVDCIREVTFTKAITIILLLSHPGAYLILKVLGAALAKGWRLFQSKENKVS